MSGKSCLKISDVTKWWEKYAKKLIKKQITKKKKWEKNNIKIIKSTITIKEERKGAT